MSEKLKKQTAAGSEKMETIKQNVPVQAQNKIQEVNRSLYDFKDAEHPAYTTEAGLTEAIVRQISCCPAH